MNFLNRLSKYLIGVLLGLGITFIMFNDRGCGSWLPKEQIRKDIAVRGIMPAENVQCLLECHNLTVSDLADLARLGDVNFSESEPRATPRKYKIEGESNILSAIYVLTDSSSTVIDISFAETKNCNCK